MLKNKNAVIYGAGGALGAAVAKAFAAAGAKVFLTGHHLKPVQKTADDIIAAGGKTEVDMVDAMHEQSIREHLQKVIKQAGTIDVSFNAVGIEVKQNVPLMNIAAVDFVQPISLTMHTRFLTAVAAAHQMMKQGSGVILSLTATPGGIGYPLTGAFATACAAVESFSRNLAGELGVYGIRVVNIRSGGSPDSKVFKQAIDNDPLVMKTLLGKMEDDTMLKRLPLMREIADTAVFLASDSAASITGVTIDVTGGTTAGLNYRMPRNGQ